MEVEGNQDVDFKAVAAGEDSSVVWVVAKQLLKPETEYLISVGDDEQSGFSQSFQTSTLVDESPPEAAVPKVERVQASGACGESNSTRIFWREIQDNGSAMPYEPIVRARVGNGDRQVELFLDAKNLVPGRGVLLASPLDQSASDCWRHAGLPFGNETPLRVQLTVFDRAGNAQELDPIDVALSRDPGAMCPSDSSGFGGCSVATRREGPNLAVTIMALAVALTSVFRLKQGARKRRRPTR
jgi:hypothetical protein